RGVVVMSCFGCSPSRKPNCSMSKQASAFFHLPSSSNQAASNCGPRRLSGSSDEYICATAPLLHTSRRRLASKRGLSCREIVTMPDGPSIITSRTSPSVSPIRAICRCLFLAKGENPRTRLFTHSAPRRVFPAPRPPTTSQVAGDEFSKYCSMRAFSSHSPAMLPSPSSLRFSAHQLPCVSLSQFDNSLVDALE